MRHDYYSNSTKARHTAFDSAGQKANAAKSVQRHAQTCWQYQAAKPFKACLADRWLQSLSNACDFRPRNETSVPGIKLSLQVVKAECACHNAVLVAQSTFVYMYEQTCLLLLLLFIVLPA